MNRTEMGEHVTYMTDTLSTVTDSLASVYTRDRLMCHTDALTSRQA